jgi:hypothetical protein
VAERLLAARQAYRVLETGKRRKSGQKLREVYVTAKLPVGRQQLERGSLRLAWALNAAFDLAPPTEPVAVCYRTKQECGIETRLGKSTKTKGRKAPLVGQCAFCTGRRPDFEVMPIRQTFAVRDHLSESRRHEGVSEVGMWSRGPGATLMRPTFPSPWEPSTSCEEAPWPKRRQRCSNG